MNQDRLMQAQAAEKLAAAMVLGAGRKVSDWPVRNPADNFTTEGTAAGSSR